jgi:hypothetical protein
MIDWRRDFAAIGGYPRPNLETMVSGVVLGFHIDAVRAKAM